MGARLAGMGLLRGLEGRSTPQPAEIPLSSVKVANSTPPSPTVLRFAESSDTDERWRIIDMFCWGR